MELKGLRLIRTRALLTQVELAGKVGMSEPAINRLERGLTKARISTVRRLILALNTSLEALLGESDQETARAA
jgi:transcriptional regulator with XRE-family HTH domain